MIIKFPKFLPTNTDFFGQESGDEEILEIENQWLHQQLVVEKRNRLPDQDITVRIQQTVNSNMRVADVETSPFTD